MKPNLLRLPPLILVIFASPTLTLSAADFPNVAVPNTSAGNTLELRANGILIGKSPSGTPSPASLLSTDEWQPGFLWHPYKQALATAQIPSEASIGYRSVALGGSNAIGNHSTALSGGWATGAWSLAVGPESCATGDYSMAVGYSTAAGYFSAALNFGSVFGAGAFAANYGQASGSYSSAFGWGTVAQGGAQTVVGIHNVPQGTGVQAGTAAPSDALFIVGNGSDGTAATSYQPIRSNALVVYKNGNMDVQGVVRVAAGGDIPMFQP